MILSLIVIWKSKRTEPTFVTIAIFICDITSEALLTPFNIDLSMSWYHMNREIPNASL